MTHLIYQVAFALVTFPGILITIVTLQLAWREYRLVRRTKVNGIVRIVTRHVLRREMMRCVKHVLLISSMAIFLPRVPMLIESPAWPFIALRVMILAMVSFLIGLQGVFDLRARRELMVYIHDHPASDTTQP